MPGLPEIENTVRILAARIGAPDHLLPTFGHSEDGARPHVEVDRAGLLHYAVVERGRDVERQIVAELDELLWHVFKHITFSMACEFELMHRVPLQDGRRLMFAKQVELLRVLSLDWADRQRRDHKKILARHPFDDAADERADLTADLRKAGRSDAEAWREACQRYPLPTIRTWFGTIESWLARSRK